MSKMSDLHLSVVEELNRGQLSWYEIACKLDIPVAWVEVVSEEVYSTLNTLNAIFDIDQDFMIDSMDGDATSALASAGFGTDEDYGYFGGDE
jgi:hypothetical protein